MVNLATFFKVPFDSKEISDDDLRAFTLDHLQRLKAAAGAKYAALVAPTEAAYTGYFGAMTGEDTAASLREGLTRRVNAAVEAFQAAVSQKEGIVRGTFGKDAPAYQEFFPRGLSEYGRATLAEIETLMTRMTDAALRHKTELGQPLADQFAALRAEFVAARTAQLGKKGEVSEGRAGTSARRDTLELQLMDNLLVLAREFKGRPNDGLALFDQSLIRRPSAASSDAEPPAAPTP